MLDYQIRKIKTCISGNYYYAIFETGKLREPKIIINEFNFEELIKRVNNVESPGKIKEIIER